MTWPRLVDRPTQDFSPQNLGFLLRHSRLNNGGGRHWQISNTMHDGLDVDKREIRKCKFPPISPPPKSGLCPHIWRLTKTLSESLRAYLSLSVLKITKPGTNLVASVNQRSPQKNGDPEVLWVTFAVLTASQTTWRLSKQKMEFSGWQTQYFFMASATGLTETVSGGRWRARRRAWWFSPGRWRSSGRSCNR